MGDLDIFKPGFDRSANSETEPQSTTETLEPCPNPECQSDKVAASNDFSNYYVYCPDCYLRGPRESVDHFGARWNALPRISPASAAPVVDSQRCVKCGHFSTVDIHDEGKCQVRGQSGFICGCECEFAPACLKCGHNAGIERTLKRCKARIDGGEALCQCHCVFPAAAATAAPVEQECAWTKIDEDWFKTSCNCESPWTDGPFCTHCGKRVQVTSEEAR